MCHRLAWEGIAACGARSAPLFAGHGALGGDKELEACGTAPIQLTPSVLDFAVIFVSVHTSWARRGWRTVWRAWARVAVPPCSGSRALHAENAVLVPSRGHLLLLIIKISGFYPSCVG